MKVGQFGPLPDADYPPYTMWIYARKDLADRTDLGGIWWRAFIDGGELRGGGLVSSGKMVEFRLYLTFVFAVLTPPEWVCRESEP